MNSAADWLEFSVRTGGEAAEAVVELFNRYGRGGAVVEVPVDCFEHELATAPPPAEVLVKAYLPLDGSDADLRQRLEEGLWHLAQILPFPPATIRRLAEEDWANAWKQQYHPLRVGRRLLIVPAWQEHEEAPGVLPILLEPGMAFGTGLHPTTRLCLRAMEDELATGCRVLDVGTGSGILAIAAVRLGAGAVVGLDTDPVAVRVAEENAARNGMSGRVAFRLGTLPGSTPRAWAATQALGGAAPPGLDEGAFDLVVANILAPVISSMAPALARHTAPAGRLVVSGIIESQEADVAAALQGQGLTILRRAQEADWVALVAGRE